MQSQEIPAPRQRGGLALVATLLACGLLATVPHPEPLEATESPRRLAGTKPAQELSASRAEDGEEGEKDTEQFWHRALQGLVEEGAEIAEHDVLGTGPVVTNADNASCEEHLRKGNFVAAFSKSCAFLENATKYCFDTMDLGTSTQWLLGSMLRDCLEQPQKWRQTWQACSAALCDPKPWLWDTSSCSLNVNAGVMDFHSALRTACVRSCVQQQAGCPGRYLDQSQWSKMLESSTSHCMWLMDRFVERLTIYEGYDAKTFAIPGVSFQAPQMYPSSHFYDRFLLLRYCSKEGLYAMHKVLFGNFSFAPSFGNELPLVTFAEYMPILDSHLVGQTLHEAIPAFLGKEALPSELLVAKGWSGCQEIIDNGIANVTAGTIRQCRSSCEQNWVPSISWHLFVEGSFLRARVWLLGRELLTRSAPAYLLLYLAVAVCCSSIAWAILKCLLEALEALSKKADKTLWDKLQILGAFVVTLVMMMLVAAVPFIIIVWCLIIPALEYIVSVAVGHGTNWVCTKAYLYQESFDPKLQYVFGGVALMLATGLTSVFHSGQSEAPAMPPLHVVGHLLLAEILLVLCPACFGLVAHYWAPHQVLGSVWWILGSIATAFGGFVIFVTIAKRCGRSVLEDARDFMYQVPGKLMMLDVFMDVSQMVAFVLIGQPFFALAQACGVVANAFLSEVAPHITVSRPVLGRLWFSISSSGKWSMILLLLLFGVLCWFDPVVLLCVLLALALYSAVAWTCAALVEGCRRWRAFTLAIFQADVLPIIWDAYKKAPVEPLAFLRKKAAEAAGEGTISLYVGLTALFKARLSANSSVTSMACILINVLLTTYSMQSGLTCLEMVAAEEKRTHQAFLQGSGEWRLAGARRPTVGRLIRAEDSMSRDRYKSTRSISDVSILRMCETLSIAVPFILLAACYNFVVALLVYLIVGLLFSFASGVCGHSGGMSILVPFVPWREPVTVPTASGSFAWAGASRLAATFTSWVMLFTEHLWAKWAPPFFSIVLQQNGARLYWSEKRRWLEEGGLGLAELLQAMIIFSGALLGLIAWLGYCHFWWKFLQLRRAWLVEDSARLMVARNPFAFIDLFPESSWEGVGEADDIWRPGSPGLPKFDDLGEADSETELYVEYVYPEYHIQDEGAMAMFRCQSPVAKKDGTDTFVLGLPKAQWANFLRECPSAFPNCVTAAFCGYGSEEPLVHRFFVGYPHADDLEEKWRVHVVGLNGQCIGRVHSSTGNVFEIDGTWSSKAEMKWQLTSQFGADHECLRWFYPPEQQPGEPAQRPCLVTDQDGVLMEVSHEIHRTFDAIDTETAGLMYVLPGCGLFQGQALQPGRPRSELPEGSEVYEVSVVEFQELPGAMTSLHSDWCFIGLQLQNHLDAEKQGWLGYFQEMFRYVQEKVTGRPSEPVYTGSRALSTAEK